jgi:hypothetical protein
MEYIHGLHDSTIKMKYLGLDKFESDIPLGPQLGKKIAFEPHVHICSFYLILRKHMQKAKCINTNPKQYVKIYHIVL